MFADEHAPAAEHLSSALPLGARRTRTHTRTHASMGLWALVAKQQTLVFPGTPDTLPIESCAMMYCNPPSDDGSDRVGDTFACREMWDAPNVVVFESLELSMQRFEKPMGITLPMIAGFDVSGGRIKCYHNNKLIS